MKWLIFQIIIVVAWCWNVWPEIARGNLFHVPFAILVAWLLTDGISEAIDGTKRLWRWLRSRAGAPGKKGSGEVSLRAPYGGSPLGLHNGAESLPRVGEKSVRKRL